ncbi:MAG: cyclase/dehydrase [Okeania sp. SIO2G5]|nr:cyclase/dehydrase [Okeania sp. SIO2G5]
MVSNDGGQFVGRVLIDASTAAAWQVLTDYDNFDQFLPNVESSQLLEASGNRHVFEQVSVVRLFPITKRVEVTIAATEQYQQQISFSQVSGDAKSIQGLWRIDPIAPYSGATPTQVLVTHQVAIEPEGGALARDLFFSTYRNVLENTLAAIQSETVQRAR